MKDLFIGRTQEISIFKKRVEAFMQGYRQNLALIGKPDCGKSFLIEYFLKAHKPKELKTVYINLEHLSYSDFISGVLLDFLKKEKTRSLPAKNINTLLEEAIVQIEKELPQTADKAKAYLARKEKPSFELLTGIIDSFIKETNSHILWVIEDFTKLLSFSRKLAAQFSKYIMSQKNIMYIFTSQKQKEAEKILAEDLNLLFGNFEKIYLENFSLADAHRFIKIKLGNTDEIVEKFIIDICGANPFYLDLLASCLKGKDKVSLDYLAFLKTLSLSLNSKISPLYQIQNAKVLRLQERFKDNNQINKLLIALAEGKRQKKQISAALGADVKKTASLLNKLGEENIVVRNGSVYYLADSLFAFWTATALKAKINHSYLLEDELDEVVFKYIEEKFMKFKEDATNNNLDKIVQLVKLFSDERIKINNKGIVLPAIRRLRVVDSYRKTMKFIIGEGKEYIIISFKETAPQEEDLQEFISRCRYFRGRKLKKIFLSLEDINENCRLLAKANNLLIWQRKEINFLLKLYNQSAIL